MLAKLAAVYPVELALHALVIAVHPPYVVTVALLATLTTALVVWVVEPSAMRALRSWLHAPALRVDQSLVGAAALWRIRATLDDRPGALEAVTHELARLQASILDIHVHPLATGVRDELVVAAPEHVSEADLRRAMAEALGRHVAVWPTTALALVDGPTRALGLAARVSADPAQLPLAVAELLGASIVTDRMRTAGGPDTTTGPTLRVPSPWQGLFEFARPDEPFTPAESARALHLAEIAEIAAVRTSASRSRPALQAP